MDREMRRRKGSTGWCYQFVRKHQMSPWVSSEGESTALLGQETECVCVFLHADSNDNSYCSPVHTECNCQIRIQTNHNVGMEAGGPGDTPWVSVWAHQLSQDTKPRTKNRPRKPAQPLVHQWGQNWTGIKPGIKNEGNHCAAMGKFQIWFRVIAFVTFDFDVERQCTVLASKCSVPSTLHCSHTQGSNK